MDRIDRLHAAELILDCGPKGQRCRVDLDLDLDEVRAVIDLLDPDGES